MEVHKYFRVKLSKDSWHFKLHVWTFDEEPKFRNFCPYFWLTIFCLVASPFVGMWKVISWTWKKLSQIPEKTIDLVDKSITKPVKTWKRINLVSDKTIYEFWKLNQCKRNDKLDYGTYENKYFEFDYIEWLDYVDRFKVWKKGNEETWEEKMEAAVKRHETYVARKESYQKKMEQRRQREMERKRQRELEAAMLEAKMKKEVEEDVEKLRELEERKRIRQEEQRKKRIALYNKIIKYTKFCMPIILGIVGLVTLYYIGVFLVYAWESWLSKFNWSLIGRIAGYTLAILGGLTIGIGAIYVLVKVVASGVSVIRLPRFSMPRFSIIPRSFKRRVANRFRNWGDENIAEPTVRVAENTKKKVNFFGQYLKATKESYCPEIIWEEAEEVEA